MSAAGNAAQYLADAQSKPLVERLAFQVGVLAGVVNHPAVYRALGMAARRLPKPVPPPLPVGAVVRRVRLAVRP